MNSTSTGALEALTNSQPNDLQLKLRQAQEVFRIGAKHPDDPLRAEFEAWAKHDRIVGSYVLKKGFLWMQRLH